jgi:ribosomal protein S18 acetylase RimI-like enzyme
MVDIIRADLTLPQHAADFIMLLDSYAYDPMGGGSGLSEYAKLNLATELNKRDDSLVLLAYVDQQPVGVCTCIEGFSTFACKPLMNIHDIAVLQEYRGKGIATALLGKAEELARQRGCCKLTLEVLSGNETAKAVYRRVGFSDYQLDPAKGHALFWEKKLEP